MYAYIYISSCVLVLQGTEKFETADDAGWCRRLGKVSYYSENAKDHPGRRALEYVGGVDISFVKGDNVNACAALVILKLPSLEVRKSKLS